MPHFSRLTDIVTCNLTELLKSTDDPLATLAEIIREMEDGLAGAQRSVSGSRRNEERLQQELQETVQQVDHWQQVALDALRADDEAAARIALYRKKEAHDLLAGLEQQVRVARSTWENLMTTYRALEARLSEARRRWQELGGAAATAQQSRSVQPLVETAQQLRGLEVEDELAELKRQLTQN